jgi:hypothetical protein
MVTREKDEGKREKAEQLGMKCSVNLGALVLMEGQLLALRGSTPATNAG